MMSRTAGPKHRLPENRRDLSDNDMIRRSKTGTAGPNLRPPVRHLFRVSLSSPSLPLCRLTAALHHPPVSE
ncbi:hypothetical protein Hanom_Chr12g01141831 [Helianthus anomalus]